ncbi:DUF4158 domain-containing protein [Labrys miyagiensis]|uniref:DUF4158 domain-containing protein n=1 Tax=Labrys miyagiensis TaxID=346912 RepID=UPI0024E0BB63|nr:DUF4158 domain-containing protein [Labrys miyagiensis]
MGRRKLLSTRERQALFAIPTDEESLIRHYTFTSAGLLEIQARRRPHNQLGFGVQLCLMRYPGRALMPGEKLPKATLIYIAAQLDISPKFFDLYARREPTRLDHVARLLSYLQKRTPVAQDRRTALLAAINAADVSDKGSAIASAVIATFHAENALLPSEDTIERIGLAGRAIARRRAEIAVLNGLSENKLHLLDELLGLDSDIGQMRYHWLRSSPDAPSTDNLNSVLGSLVFLRRLNVDSQLAWPICSTQKFA